MNRFWSKVNKNTESGCWEWTAGRDGHGYGKFYLHGKDIGAHRASWEIHNGKIPEAEGYHGMCVLHKCDNPLCINPSHLWLGTNLDNMRDRDKKGRAAHMRNNNKQHLIPV